MNNKKGVVDSLAYTVLFLIATVLAAFIIISVMEGIEAAKEAKQLIEEINESKQDSYGMNNVYYQNIFPSNQCTQPIADSFVHSSRTGSMRPTINYGDTVGFVLYDHSLGLVEGDIVIVRRDGLRSVVHRVVGLADDYFTMKGDNNFYSDGVRYSYDDIVSVVCTISRGTNI